MIYNAFTIDVEDYFQVSAFESVVSRSRWSEIELRVEKNTDLILELLNRYNVRGTFFILGWVAERCPDLVRRVVGAGHELASHGYNHQRVHQMTPTEFFEDVSRSKSILEQIAGVGIKGFRAPSFSINRHSWWAFDYLARAGYLYSSSIYPVNHDHYGVPEAPRGAFSPVENLIEIPISTFRIRKKNFPGSGGGYFRLLPYAASKLIFENINSKDQAPVIFYFHPWELDPMQPRIKGLDAKTKFRHYVNLSRMQEKIERLLRDFRWRPLIDIVNERRQCGGDLERFGSTIP